VVLALDGVVMGQFDVAGKRADTRQCPLNVLLDNHQDTAGVSAGL
jgi:hypothetical protein